MKAISRPLPFFTIADFRQRDRSSGTAAAQIEQSNSKKQHIVYVSYDAVTEPLGHSQVLGYLKTLADSFDITLISFEKRRIRNPRVVTDLGIRWLPLKYHGVPAVASTAFDILNGARALSGILKTRPFSLVHTRSYVATEMSLRCRRARHTPLLFDIRGFWVDERLEGGLWKRGMLSEYAMNRQSAFFRRADAVVTLTEASVPFIHPLVRHEARIDVIPTCAELGSFPINRARDNPHLIWLGSLGTWYRFDLAVKAARVSGSQLLAFTSQIEAARDLVGSNHSVRSVSPDRVPHILRERDIGLCLCKQAFSKIASMPTRAAEYLAAGMPIVATPGIGDLNRLLATRGVGITLEGESPEELARAVSHATRLAMQQDTPDRCRAVAREYFCNRSGAQRYAEIYSSLCRKMTADARNGS